MLNFLWPEQRPLIRSTHGASSSASRSMSLTSSVLPVEYGVHSGHSEVFILRLKPRRVTRRCPPSQNTPVLTVLEPKPLKINCHFYLPKPRRFPNCCWESCTCMKASVLSAPVTTCTISEFQSLLLCIAYLSASLLYEIPWKCVFHFSLTCFC